MDAALLGKLFGREPRWHGPCVVILNAESAIQTMGADSIGASAAKSYAPRVVSGRVLADSVCLAPDAKALLIVQHQKVRQGTGEEILKQTLLVVDPLHVAAIEFFDTAQLANLGITASPQRPGNNSGALHRPGF